MADIPADGQSPSGLKIAPKIPGEIINIVGTAVGIFVAVFAGSALAERLPPSAWNTAAAYAIPAGLVWLAYRWLVRKL